MNKFLQGLAWFLLSVTSMYYKYAVAVKVWGYILVPMGAPAISITQAVGLSFVVDLLSNYPVAYVNVEPEGYQSRVVKSFSYTSIIWLITYYLFKG